MKLKLRKFVDVGHGAAPGVDDLTARAELLFKLVEVPAVLAADVVGGVGKLRLVEAGLGVCSAGAAVEEGAGDLVFFHFCQSFLIFNIVSHK